MTAGSTNSADQLSIVYESPQTRGIGGINLSGLWALYVLTLRQHMHGKRWMLMALMFLLLAALVVVVRITAHHMTPIMIEFSFAFMFLPQVVLPLVALMYASGIIHDEQEEQTITYLLIRPIPKWALYVVKLVATLTTTIVLTAVFTALTYAVVYVGASPGAENIPERAVKAIAVQSLAMIAYCCLFGLLSLLTKRVLVAGILYSVAIEGVFANFPFGIRYATVIYYTRLIAYHMMSFVRADWNIDLADGAWQLGVKDDPKLSAHPTVSTCLTVLLAASLVCTVAAAVICSRREFHVKTPEKE
jgi:ABC-2 type transport system permease protein